MTRMCKLIFLLGEGGGEKPSQFSLGGLHHRRTTVTRAQCVAEYNQSFVSLAISFLVKKWAAHISRLLYCMFFKENLFSIYAKESFPALFYGTTYYQIKRLSAISLKAKLWVLCKYRFLASFNKMRVSFSCITSFREKKAILWTGLTQLNKYLFNTYYV